MDPLTGFEVKKLQVLPSDAEATKIGLIAGIGCTLVNGREVRGIRLHAEVNDRFSLRCDRAEISPAPPTLGDFRPLSPEELGLISRSLMPFLADFFAALYPEIPTVNLDFAPVDGPSTDNSLSPPINPMLAGDGVITLRHVSGCTFRTPGGAVARFTDLTTVKDVGDENEDVFMTPTGQLVHVIDRKGR